MFEYLLSREEFSNFVILLQHFLSNVPFALQTLFESVCIFIIILLYFMALRVLYDLVYYFVIVVFFFIFH